MYVNNKEAMKMRASSLPGDCDEIQLRAKRIKTEKKEDGHDDKKKRRAKLPKD